MIRTTSQLSTIIALIGFVLALSHFSSGAAQADRQKEIARARAILRRPLPPEDQVEAREELARQQVESAITLLKLSLDAAVWPLFRHTIDPTVRTYLIHDVSAMNVDPRLIINRLRIERNASARQALILSLGQFSDSQVPLAMRETIVSLLITWYRNDPNSGVHAAIDWLFRHNAHNNLDWKQAETLATIDRELKDKPPAKRNWHITREGQVMAVLRGPVTFRMGSPKYERGRVSASDSPKETLHPARIPRSFAIASKEITVAQFQRFLDANPEVKARFAYAGDPERMTSVLRRFAPDPEGPQIAVTWYEAAMYCNWLSKQEGLPESEWAYPTSFDQIKDGMMMPRDYLHRTGYRLPTEAEWEYAARSGSTTSRFFGNNEELLSKYAWYSKHPPHNKNDPADPNDPQRPAPVGQLMPNEFGLFDAYGNVWEWCQDRLRYYAPDELTNDIEDDVLLVSDKVARSRRGGAFSYEAAMQRSAERDTVNAFPNLRRDTVGFRIVRTLH